MILPDIKNTAANGFEQRVRHIVHNFFEGLVEKVDAVLIGIMQTKAGNT